MKKYQLTKKGILFSNLIENESVNIADKVAIKKEFTPKDNLILNHETFIFHKILFFYITKLDNNFVYTKLCFKHSFLGIAGVIEKIYEKLYLDDFIICE